MTNDTLYRISMISPISAIAVGANGTILKTIDQGLHWDKIGSSVQSAIRSIAFRNDIAVAVGYDGIILRSEDMGENWEIVNSGIHTNLYTVSFATNNTLLAGGDSTLIISSTDGGRTWKFNQILYRVLDTSTPNSIHEIQFVNDSTGYMCGSLYDIYSFNGFYPFQRILYTTDTGNTWKSLVGINPLAPSDKFYDRNNSNSQYGYWHKIAIINPDSIIAVGNYQDYQTSKIIAGGPNSPLFELRLNEVTTAQLGYVSATKKDFESIYSTSLSHWKLTTFNGELISTTDSGESWTSLQVSSGSRCYDTKFRGDFGIMTCDSSRVYITNDGGITWKLNLMDRAGAIISVRSPEFFDVVIISPTTAMCKGDFGYRQKLIRTSNSGESWERITIHSDSNVSYSAPYFIDELHGWIFARPHIVDSANKGIGFKQGKVYFTADGGISWIDKTPYSIIRGDNTFEPLRMHFTDKLHGCFTAFDQGNTQSKAEGAYLFQTDDGGETWSRHYLDFQSVFGAGIIKFTLQTVDFIGIDSLNYVLYAGFKYNNQVIRTTDGGMTWKIMTVNSLAPEYNSHRVFYQADSTTLFMIGKNNTLYRWEIDKTVSSVTEQPEPSDGITISPNPSSTSFMISGIDGVTSVRIMNSLGMEAKKITVNSEKFSIDVSDLASGVYFVQFRSQTGVVSKPVVVNR